MINHSKNDSVILLKSGRKLGYSEYGDPEGKPVFYFHGWPDDIIQLADHLKIKKFAVMGVSGGGPYAAATAYKIPQRLTKVGIIVGLSPIVPGSLEGISFLARIGWSNYGRFPLLRTIGTLLHYINVYFIPSSLTYRYLFSAKQDKKFYTDPLIRQITKRNFKEAFRTGYKGAELDLKLYTHDWGFNLKDIKTKVYLWYGEDDKNVSLNMGNIMLIKLQTVN